MYEHVFELLLRLKGNYLWPAMWAPRAFTTTTRRTWCWRMPWVWSWAPRTMSPPDARAGPSGIATRNQGVTGGKWDYTTNADNLRKFWRGGMERMMSKGDGQGYECLVTVGMRGDGDEPMSEGTATQLLESVVAAQRDIIRDVTGKPAEQQPQVWALYKEVQDYYDHGMKVPDDVTLLFSDDNWGQIRRLPTGDLNRKGGYGVYYHFDYVGGPRKLQVAEHQPDRKDLAADGPGLPARCAQPVDRHVGDIKPMEFPLAFSWNRRGIRRP